MLFVVLLLAQVLQSGSTSCSRFAGEEAIWSYEGSTGPPSWGSLSNEFVPCESSMRQSPINIVANETFAGGCGAMRGLLKINPRAMFKPTASPNNVQFDCESEEGCGGLTVGSKEFSLVQFHFHSRSEHEMDGRPASFEIHLVHEHLETSRVAVVGVLLNAIGRYPHNRNYGAEREDACNRSVVDIEDPLDAIGTLFDRGQKFQYNLNKVVDLFSGYFTYEGGSTTPACIDPRNLGVTWFIQSKIAQISSEQVMQFLTLVGPVPRGNWRPCQELHGRVVKSISGCR